MVNLTLFPDRMCSLWNCRREVAHTFYCVNNNCEQQAANNITCQRPINLRNLYTHGELERLFLPKILFHLIHQVGNTGIPDLTGNLQILSQHPNDQPQRFATNLSPREDFSIWIFLACFAPHTQIWTGGNQIVDGNYVRKVFRPRVMQPNGAVWILHRYALVNNPATAFYTLQYKKPVLRHPLEQIQYMYADDDGNNGPDDSDDLDDDQDDEVVSCRRKRLKITHGPARPETAIWSNEKPDLKGTGRIMLNPLTSLSTGIHKTDSFQHYSEMDDDASLERAVESLVLALKKYEKKLKCAAEKKFSEIIASTFEDIHLELENVKNNVFSEEDVALLALALNTCEKDLISAAVEKSSEILATVFEEIRLELDHLKDVALLALALNTCEKNLISAAVKKSSEILATVFEEIHQLENLKSDISSEAGKTSNLANTKTQKFLATVFKELESLKSDISSEADFMCTTEGLEADRSEFKGSIKKQGTSHQKLIGQFEGYIETKMENATKRIDSV